MFWRNDTRFILTHLNKRLTIVADSLTILESLFCTKNMKVEVLIEIFLGG